MFAWLKNRVVNPGIGKASRIDVIMDFDRNKLSSLLQTESQAFIEANPKSKMLFERANTSLSRGVPMPWMSEWASPFPLFIDHAQAAYVRDVDGHEYVDFCLGDTGALFGHSPEPVANAVIEQANKGYSYLLPTEDAICVGEALQQRFKMPYWQFAMTATDANRFAIKLARAVTGRSLIAVFDGCYHGSLDETLVSLNAGNVEPLASNIGLGVNPAKTTRVVDFNDLEGLEAALKKEDIACLLCEPVLTNNGLVFPEPGFHAAVRELTENYGTLLIVDETHTICAGPGGATREFALEPDIITIGKPISGGIPAAAYGFSESVGQDVGDWIASQQSFVTGIGGTLSGNALSMRAMRACLETVMSDEAYQSMTDKAEQLVKAVERIIIEFNLPWSITRLGARIEYSFHQTQPRNAREAIQYHDPELEKLFRLFFLNRGLMLTIFYNVALISPQTTMADINRHTEVFREFARTLSS